MATSEKDAHFISVVKGNLLGRVPRSSLIRQFFHEQEFLPKFKNLNKFGIEIGLLALFIAQGEGL